MLTTHAPSPSQLAAVTVLHSRPRGGGGSGNGSKILDVAVRVACISDSDALRSISHPNPAILCLQRAVIYAALPQAREQVPSRLIRAVQPSTRLFRRKGSSMST